MKEVLKALRPVKVRMRRNRFLRGAAAGLAAGLAAAAALQAAAFFTPVPDRGLWAAAAAAAAMLTAALANAARPVKNETAARAADACGLKERAITALEEGTEPIRELQRRDACAALEKLDVKQIRPGSVKKQLSAALGCAVLLAALLLIPSPQDQEASSRKALARTLQEGRETVERAAEEDEERLPEEKKSELRKITADLNRELGESRDAADALVALDRAEQRLEQLRQQTAGDAAETAEGAAGDSGAGDGEQAGAPGGNTSGDAARAAEGQKAPASAADAAAGQMKTLQALNALKTAVNPSLQGNGMRTENADQPAQAGQSGAGTGGNTPGRSGRNGSSAGGSGLSGMTGSGAGEGSTNEEQQGSGNSGSGPVKGSRDPHYREAEYETIYDPEHIDKNRQDVLTEQFRTEDEDSLQIETGPGRGNVGGDVPWREALQDYAETEARAADRENLTVQEKQWVNEYYRLLTEQR